MKTKLIFAVVVVTLICGCFEDSEKWIRVNSTCEVREVNPLLRCVITETTSTTIIYSYYGDDPNFCKGIRCKPDTEPNMWLCKCPYGLPTTITTTTTTTTTLRDGNINYDEYCRVINPAGQDPKEDVTVNASEFPSGWWCIIYESSCGEFTCGRSGKAWLCDGKYCKK